MIPVSKDNSLLVRAALLVAMATMALVACDDPESSPLEGASAQLEAVTDQMWTHTLATDVSVRIQRGLPVTDLPPISFADTEAEVERQRGFLAQLTDVDRGSLALAEQLTLDALVWETSMEIEGFEHFWLTGFLTPYASPLRTLAQVFPALPLTAQEELERYLELAGRLPAFIATMETRARGQAERGIAVSEANLPNVVSTWRAQATPAEQSLLWPDDSRLSDMPEASVMVFRAQLAQIVEEEVNPAFESLASYLEGGYADVAPAGVGLSQYTGGPAYYRYLTRLNTTMEVSPEQVQEVGRQLLDEFRRSMEAIRQEVGFDGSREEFHELLRTDPRFFPSTPAEVADRLKSAADSMWSRVHDYFEVTQQAPYGARRLRADLEPTMTYGYYSPPSAADPMGYYNFNGSSLDERSWIGLTAIGLHELIPGHHFQVARQLENLSLPELRRSRRHTAYTEGWGSYASFLGLEAGVYEDPYSRYGLYALESFLATRLVVDPGMNYFGMTLEEGRAFMRENTLESATQIATESLRYSTDIPGQALGYQMGRQALIDLRNRARTELGDAFDLSAFHEAILENGSLPMVVLEHRISRFVDDPHGAGADR